jgi:predicted phosphodiesterase
VRLAFISDVHANIVALKAACSAIKKHEVDRIYCAGDLIGYGPRPAEVIDFFMSQNIQTVLGNHDASVTGRAEFDSYHFKNDAERRYVESSYNRTIQDLSPSHIDYLSNLPIGISISECSLFLTHCIPDMFAYPDEGFVGAFMAKNEFRYLFFGHTHNSSLYSFEKGKMAISIPSIGKPRLADALAGYCIAEINDGRLSNIQFSFCEYDVETVRREIIEKKYPLQTLDFLQVDRFQVINHECNQ